MPRVFKALEIEKEDKEIKRDYLDRHMPHVICPDQVKRGEKFAVKVKLGEEYPHPDEHDHFISYGTGKPSLPKHDIRPVYMATSHLITK
jgi:superoxide reductase